MIGQTIGNYRIAAKLGEGGMGEVYRAHDPHLSRDVAIKFSKQQFSERFEREARAVVALTHPNTAHLYDVGPLPLDEALRNARQIADALEAPHEKGIVHRDLEPGNIKIKPDGAAYDVSPDGKRFLAAIPVGLNSDAITVVLNWQAGLKK